MARLDHVPIVELHGLGTLSTKLSGDDDLTSLGRRLHDEADDAVTGPTDGKSTEQLEFQGFGLRLGAESAVLDAFGVQFDGAVGKVEALLNDAGEFADALSLFAQDVLGASGADDNFGAVRRGADLDPGVAVLGQFASQELIEFRVKDSVGDKLAFRRKATAACSGHDVSGYVVSLCEREQGKDIM